jgi:hypothetical protein
MLILQISNFMHAKGGMRDPIRLVAAAQVSGFKHRALVKDVTGVRLPDDHEHLPPGPVRLSPSDRFNLYFALLCLFFGLRAGLTGEVFLVDLFPSLDWQMTVRMEWLCVYIGAPLGIAFVRSLFPVNARWGSIRAAWSSVRFWRWSPCWRRPPFSPACSLHDPADRPDARLYCLGILKAALAGRFGAVVDAGQSVAGDRHRGQRYALRQRPDSDRVYHSLRAALFRFSQAMILANRSPRPFIDAWRRPTWPTSRKL